MGRHETKSNLMLMIDWLTQRGPLVILLRIVMQVSRIILGRPIYHYSEIVPGVFVGGQYRARGWPSMKAQGITAVVNLRRSDDRARGIAPERYLHLPTTDNTAPMVEDLIKGVLFIREELERGGAVYIHCGVGVGRAPTLTAAYLVSTGMLPAQAWDTIRKTRPFIWPMPGQYGIVRRFADEWAVSGANYSAGVSIPDERSIE